MQKETTFKDFISSKGMEYLNRAHYRSFTRNIFIGNTEQLLHALNSLTDPLEYFKTLADRDLEKSHQTIREVSRLFHNFLAGAMTLVDHTRVFVDEYYLGTLVNKEFKSRVNKNFLNNKLTRFVQDLRNYMVHRGLPPLERHLTMKPIEGGRPGEVTAETGFQLPTAELQQWNGWKSDAKQYLKESGEKIDLMSLIVRYRILIDTFHNEFDELLREYHKDDLAYLAAMQAQLNSALPGSSSAGES
jgi:hypothetical protein